MYNEYFGFREAPFSIAPDPRYLYMTAQHRDALAHLVYGLNSEGGCILLTGEVGTGKTTICRCLLEQIPEQAHVALVLNPKVNEIELLETICDELKITYPDDRNSIKTYTDRIYDFLIESNRNNEKTVLIIDEAQNLDSKVLEQLRLLTNLETNQRKLLQIIILGQPELLDILSRPDMRQLAQRITARFHLKPLTRDELKAYISHRLAVAGQNVQLIPENCIKLLYRLSNGIPRLINVICDRALLGAYVENQYNVTPEIMKKAATEVFGELKHVEHDGRKKQKLYPLAAVSTLLLLLFAVFAYFIVNTDKLRTAPPLAVAPEAAESADATPAAAIETSALSETPTTAQPSAGESTAHMAAAAATDTVSVNDAAAAPDTTNTANIAAYDDIYEILAGASGNPAFAYAALFQTWGVQFDYNSRLTACRQAENHALSCLYKHGNINSLKRHNRPAILTLTDDQGQNRYITITAINDDIATVSSGDSSYTMKLNELDRYWYGKFILLWRKPEQYSSAVKPGDSGSIVNWINTRLATINGTPANDMLQTYDARLAEQVKAFQIAQGLTPDGIVGPVTIIHLNTQSGTRTPVLISTSVATGAKQS